MARGNEGMETGQSPIFDAGERDPKSRKLRLASAFVAALTVAAIWAYSFVPTPTGDGRAYLKKLREEFSKISPPDGTSAMDHMTVKAKSSSALVETRYTSQRPAESVVESFTQELSSNGWTHAGRFRGGVRYCKGELGASVEVMPPDGIVVVSMSWNDVTIRECSRKP